MLPIPSVFFFISFPPFLAFEIFSRKSPVFLEFEEPPNRCDCDIGKLMVFYFCDLSPVVLCCGWKKHGYEIDFYFLELTGAVFEGLECHGPPLGMGIWRLINPE